MKEHDQELKTLLSELISFERLALVNNGIPAEHVKEYKNLKERIKNLRKMLTETP